MDNERIAHWEKVHNGCIYYWDGDESCHCKRKECFFKNRIKEELGDRVVDLSFVEKIR